MNIKRLTLLALLTSVALIIFVIELQIPNLVPIPGIKLGLANIVTVYSIYHFKASETFFIVVIRILLGSFFNGNISAMLYSFSGALLCLLGMILLKRFIDEKYIWVCSILGAVLHNVGQISAAIILMKTTAVIVYLPFLIVSGCIAGGFTGMCAQILVKRININDFLK